MLQPKLSWRDMPILVKTLCSREKVLSLNLTAYMKFNWFEFICHVALIFNAALCALLLQTVGGFYASIRVESTSLPTVPATCDQFIQT